MTMHDEPPMVDLDEILDERDTEGTRVTGGQLALVLVGGLVGAAGLLTLLVVTAPVLLELVQAIHTLTELGTLTP
jgi:hypothetical protein